MGTREAGGAVFATFLVAVTQHLKRSHLREEGLLLAYILRSQIVFHLGEAWRQKHELLGHMMSTVRKQSRNRKWVIEPQHPPWHWPTSFIEAQPPKGSTTFLNITKLGPSVCTHDPKWGDFTLLCEFSRGDRYKHFFTPDRALTTD